MASLVYKAKRLARAPMIWRGRRQHADEAPAVKAKLEQHLYRRKVQDHWVCVAMDPHYIYRARLDADSVIVDVGAFRGHVALELFELYGGHVHAFEPADTFYEDMVQRFEGNDRLHAHHYGLGKRDAMLSLSTDGMASSFETETTYRDAAPTTTVQIRDVADAFDEIGLERIDFMKINIEGGEFDLLERLHETGWLDRTRYLLIQFHEWYDKAEVRRWRARRQLKEHHKEQWCCPWIYELWCHEDQLPYEWTDEERAQIEAAMRAEFAAKTAAEAAGSD